MSGHSHVPTFGNWETDNTTSYTTYFEKARGGRMMSQNDRRERPSQDPSVVRDATSNVKGPQTPPPRTGAREASKRDAGGSEADAVISPHKTPPRQNEYRSDRSPFHPMFTARGKDNPQEGKEGGHGATQMASVPVFGEWDEKNPSAADGYTDIFTKLRQERQTGAGNAPVMGPDAVSYTKMRKPEIVGKKGCGCFGWK